MLRGSAAGLTSLAPAAFDKDVEISRVGETSLLPEGGVAPRRLLYAVIVPCPHLGIECSYLCSVCGVHPRMAASGAPAPVVYTTSFCLRYVD